MLESVAAPRPRGRLRPARPWPRAPASIGARLRRACSGQSSVGLPQRRRDRERRMTPPRGWRLPRGMASGGPPAFDGERHRYQRAVGDGVFTEDVRLMRPREFWSPGRWAAFAAARCPVTDASSPLGRRNSDSNGRQVASALGSRGTFAGVAAGESITARRYASRCSRACCCELSASAAASSRALGAVVSGSTCPSSGGSAQPPVIPPARHGRETPHIGVVALTADRAARLFAPLSNRLMGPGERAGQSGLIRAWRATGRGTPINPRRYASAIGDSADVIAALKERYSAPPLCARSAAAR